MFLKFFVQTSSKDYSFDFFTHLRHLMIPGPFPVIFYSSNLSNEMFREMNIGRIFFELMQVDFSLSQSDLVKIPTKTHVK